MFIEGASQAFPVTWNDDSEVKFSYTTGAKKSYTVWLMDVALCDSPSSGSTGNGCSGDRWQKLNGFDDLSDVTGVEATDLIISAMDYYLLKKDNADWKLDGTWFAGQTLPLASAARTPGFFTIPTCDSATVLANVQKYTNANKPCDDYPCCT